MRKTWLIFSQAVTVSVAVLFVVATLKPDWLRRSGQQGMLPNIVSIIEAPADSASGVLRAQSYSAAAKRAGQPGRCTA